MINYHDWRRSIYSNDFRFVPRIHWTFLAQPLLMTLKIISSRNFFLCLCHFFLHVPFFFLFFFFCYLLISFFLIVHFLFTLLFFLHQTQTNRRTKVIRPSTPTSQQNTACARRKQQKKKKELEIEHHNWVKQKTSSVVQLPLSTERKLRTLHSFIVRWFVRNANVRVQGEATNTGRRHRRTNYYQNKPFFCRRDATQTNSLEPLQAFKKKRTRKWWRHFKHICRRQIGRTRACIVVHISHHMTSWFRSRFKAVKDALICSILCKFEIM